MSTVIPGRHSGYAQPADGKVQLATPGGTVWVTPSEAAQVGARVRPVEPETVDLAGVKFPPDALETLAGDAARRLKAVPIRLDDGELTVACTRRDRASRARLGDDLRQVTGRRIRLVWCEPGDLGRAMDRAYPAMADLDGLGGVDDTGPDALADDVVVTGEDESEAVLAVDTLLRQAVADGASDIHLQPTSVDLRARLRVDGVLRDLVRLPAGLRRGIMGRLKIMCDAPSLDSNQPMDLSATWVDGGQQVDLRVATMPTVRGEKATIRLLHRQTACMGLDDLGFSPENLARFRAGLARPNGIVLVTGPTNMGKSTTGYAALQAMRDDTLEIVTVEDPVEYKFDGITQLPVNARRGNTFANLLRSVLRSDPDVVFVGEIRDAESAQIGCEAALTGHRVLSTLHTNDAPSAVTRLVEIGVEPYLVAAVVTCVVAQRLVRRLCLQCRVPTGTAGVFTASPGCPACRNGYRGMIAVHEVMTVTARVTDAILARCAGSELRAIAVAEGMGVLRDDGMAKVAAGVTSEQEVCRVLG